MSLVSERLACQRRGAICDGRASNKKACISCRPFSSNLVPRRGLEPPRSYPLVPETSASTNSATWAFQEVLDSIIKTIKISNTDRHRRRADERSRRHGARPPRRPRLRRARRPPTRHLPVAAGDARGPAPRPCQGARHALRPQGPPRRAACSRSSSASKAPIIGRLLHESGIWLVAPEDKRYGQDIMIPKNAIANATAGQVVAIELTEPPSMYSQPDGPRHRGARRDRRPRHGDRDRGAQVRGAAPLLARDARAGGGAARQDPSGRPQATAST